MKLYIKSSRHKRGAVSGPVSLRNAGSEAAGFTLIEVMVVIGLTTILIVSTFGSILSMKINSSRTADYTAMMAIVEAKIQDIRVATYNPPNYPFGASTLYLTNSGSIALDKLGTTFYVPGTVVSKIEPVAAGHLITVTGNFFPPGVPISVTLQSVVNKYCGGQQ